ncbi:hypothetical protein [Macrococcus armenti]|uniref:hypothetical protein n=1 Tax=Macrococcus armenti TaxID=2875764 RepID=UPI001CCFE428|nr:hypothetical protein [Macrococcus armenti]UBH09201.1 hypothetical protein LAU41_03260 [Macrococcus armenti]UBH11496.1 hypothetical protein LAU38_03250 [Macrococcus armenti]
MLNQKEAKNLLDHYTMQQQTQRVMEAYVKASDLLEQSIIEYLKQEPALIKHLENIQSNFINKLSVEVLAIKGEHEISLKTTEKLLKKMMEVE